VRITVSLDEDVNKGIREEMGRSGDSFKTVVDRLLRLGLVADGCEAGPSPSNDPARAENR
jgi:hypothetical protein